MSKSKEFWIEFDKLDALFISGEIVSGRVCLRLPSSKSVKGEEMLEYFKLFAALI